MYLTLLRKFVIFLGVVLVITQALSVAVHHTEARDAIGISSSDDGRAAIPLEARIPRGSRGGRKGGSRRPLPKSKQGKKKNTGSKAKSRMKPSLGSKKKPGGKQKPGTKQNPGTSPSPKPSAVTFPKLKVPYVDIATDLCGIYIDCVDRHAGKRDVSVVAVEKPALDSRTHTLEGRTRNSGGLPELPYPSSSQLYSGARRSNTKEILRFRNNKLGSTAVKSFQSILPTEIYSDYATEHIIELQTIRIFHDWAVERDPELEDFFEHRWNEQHTEPEIKARTHKPSYYKAQTALRGARRRLTLNALVFDALGSTFNFSVFVLLKSEINLYKAKLWTQNRPIDPDKFKKAYKEALSGARPSSDYLSAIRTVFGVFSYLNTKTVHDKMKNIHENLVKEFSNAAQITGDNNAQNLGSMWKTFLEERFDMTEQFAKEWTKNSIDEAQEAIQTALAKYEKMFRERENAELEAQKEGKAGKGSKGKGKGRATYADERREEHKVLSAKLAQDKKEMRAARAELRTLRATQKANTKNWTESERTTHKLKIEAEESKVAKAEGEHGLTKRAIHELYSYSVKMIITNLKKDQQRLLSFEKKIHTLKMPQL